MVQVPVRVLMPVAGAHDEQANRRVVRRVNGIPALQKVVEPAQVIAVGEIRDGRIRAKFHVARDAGGVSPVQPGTNHETLRTLLDFRQRRVVFD